LFLGIYVTDRAEVWRLPDGIVTEVRPRTRGPDIAPAGAAGGPAVAPGDLLVTSLPRKSDLLPSL